jgi:hypothetical protein
MAKLSQRQQQWLSSLSRQEACQETVKEAIARTHVDAKKGFADDCASTGFEQWLRSSNLGWTGCLPKRTSR